jgi:glycosyltransferase involved in cell wall biosynthesis
MWNEEQYITRALNAGHHVARELMDSGEVADYELIVVNDASTDATARLADEAAAADPRVRVVHHPVNRKLGGSMKSGFAAATGDVIVYTDADLPFDMRELHKALRLLRQYEADVVSAYRFDRTDEGLVRVVYSAFYNLLVRVLFGVRIRDVNFAFKVCRGSIFRNISLKSEGSFIDAELIVRAKNCTIGWPSSSCALRSSAIRSCSSASTTFLARAAYRPCRSRRSSSRFCARRSLCAAN